MRVFSTLHMLQGTLMMGQGRGYDELPLGTSRLVMGGGEVVTVAGEPSFFPADIIPHKCNPEMRERLENDTGLIKTHPPVML